MFSACLLLGAIVGTAVHAQTQTDAPSTSPTKLVCVGDALASFADGLAETRLEGTISFTISEAEIGLTVAQCAQKCLEEPICVSFEYGTLSVGQLPPATPTPTPASNACACHASPHIHRAGLCMYAVNRALTTLQPSFYTHS